MFTRRSGAVVLAGGLFAVLATAACSSTTPEGKIPITTSNDEARNLFLEARSLSDNIDATDAYVKYQQAAATDPGFAMAYVGMANNAPSADTFVEAVNKAVTLVDGVSDGERHVILALEAGLKSDPEAQMQHTTELVTLYPNDERAHMQMGTLYFGRQNYAEAVTHYQHAIDINPDFAPVYNMLGYAERFQGDDDAAEAAFRKYIELIPDNPNPHDSYAEFLMEAGRFDESIQHYEQALALDPNWMNGYVGIGNNQMFLSRFDDARATFGRELESARNTGERRQALGWIAASYIHEGKTDEAVAAIERARELSRADGDLPNVAASENQIGNILLEAGRYDESLAHYAAAVETMNAAMDVPEEFKTTTARNALFFEGRVAAARGDLAPARARLDSYAAQVAEHQIPNEERQQHELAGMIAMAAKDFPTALSELQQANQRDPRVLFMIAKAHEGAGDMDAARQAAAAVADFNSLAFSLAFVQDKAEMMAGR